MKVQTNQDSEKISEEKKESENKILNIGRFTIVEINENGVIGVGISRRSQGDSHKLDIGFSIAKARAKKAIEYKKKKKKLHHPLMG